MTETIKACVKCNKDFKTDREFQSHVCSANQINNNNPTKVYFINLADSPDLDDENEVPNERLSDPRNKTINCQNNTKYTNGVRPKGSSITLDLGSDIPIIIDDENKFINSKPRSIDLNNKISEKNMPRKLVNIGSRQNTETNVSINPEIYINPNVIIIDDDSSNNSEIVCINDDDNVRIDDTSVLRDNISIELTDKLINSNNSEDLRLINSNLEESSDALNNDTPQIYHDKLSEVLETISTDLNTMLGADEIKKNNLDIPQIISEDKNYVTGVAVENSVPNTYGGDDIIFLANNNENESNKVEVRNMQKQNDLPYLDIEDVNPSIYLDNGEMEELDIMKDTEINMEDVDPEIVLDNVKDSNATLENEFVSNVLESYNSKVNRDFSDPKDIVDLESVILGSNMDMVDLDDVNPSVEIEKVLEDVDPEAILESDDFDPKALENCLDVLDTNVLEDSVRVIEPQYNSEIDLNLLDPKTVKEISSSFKVDDSNIISATGLDGNINLKVAVISNINIVDSNNVQCGYFTKDSESDMQAVASKIILERNNQLGISNSLDNKSTLSVNSNPIMKTNTQLKNEIKNRIIKTIKIIKTEKLPTSVNNVSALNLNILSDYDLTSAKPHLLSDPRTFENLSNQNLCDLGKFVLEDVVYNKTIKNTITQSKFKTPITKTQNNSNKSTKMKNVIKPITWNKVNQINLKPQTRDCDQSVLTDSMLDSITSNPHANTKEAEHIMEIVSNLEESIGRELYCRNVSTNTYDADIVKIDENDDRAKPISLEELVKVSMPSDSRTRFRNLRNKKTQTDCRRVKPYPQYEEKIRDTGVLEQIPPPPKVVEGPELKGKYKHICTICNSRYDRISRLRIHMRRHTQDLKYQCELCDYKFVVQYDLDRHHRIVHLGNKKKGKSDNNSGVSLSKSYPHKCEYCRMFFQTTSGLREHRKRHTKELFLMEANRPVECDVCQKKFIKSLIADHKAKAHGLL